MDPDSQRRVAAPKAQAARSRTHATLLDGRLIRRLRFLRGLSQSQLAAATGVNEQVIYRLEHGSRQNTLTVSFIVDLAHALGAQPVELIRPTEPAAGGDVIADGDIATVGSMLMDAAGWVDVDDLAGALDWTPDRTLVALDSLQCEAQRCGQRLAWTNDREVRLCAAPNDCQALRDITVRDIDRQGLSRSEAKVLHLLLRSRQGDAQAASVAARYRVEVGRLVAAGLVDGDVPVRDHNRRVRASAAEKLRLSDAAERALLLD